MKISNRSRKSFLNPKFFRAGSSPIKTGERGKLESLEGMVKRAKFLPFYSSAPCTAIFFCPWSFRAKPTEWFKQCILIQHSRCVLQWACWNTLSQICSCGEQNRRSRFGGSIWLKQGLWSLGLAVSRVQLQKGWRLRPEILFYGMLHAEEMMAECGIWGTPVTSQELSLDSLHSSVVFKHQEQTWRTLWQKSKHRQV